jgi:hypothetical protein
VATPRDQEKARDIISRECEASILRRFPSQWLDETLGAIADAARKGDRDARTAKKLLTDGRFKKPRA